jgi:hypothetical protein
MAVFTEKLCFNHMPKTAGRWITNTFEAAGIDHEIVGGGAHNLVRPHQLSGRRVFTVVRHPFVWLASFHAHRRKKEKWFGLNLEELWHDDWQQFLYNTVLNPGCLKQYWDHYCDWPDIAIIRCENLAQDLFELMSECQHPGDLDMIKARADHIVGNHSNQTQHKIRSTPPMRYEEFYQSQRWVFDHFGYTKDHSWWTNKY